MKVEKIEKLKETSLNGAYVSNIRHVSFLGAPANINEDGDSFALQSYTRPTLLERIQAWLSTMIGKFSRK